MKSLGVSAENRNLIYFCAQAKQIQGITRLKSCSLGFRFHLRDINRGQNLTALGLAYFLIHSTGFLTSVRNPIGFALSTFSKTCAGECRRRPPFMSSRAATIRCWFQRRNSRHAALRRRPWTSTFLRPPRTFFETSSDRCVGGL